MLNSQSHLTRFVWALILLLTVTPREGLVAFGAEIEVLAETSPLVPSRALKAEVVARRLYLQGGFDDRTTTGEQLLGYVLTVSITNAAGHVLATSEINSSWAGYAFDTMIAKDLDPGEITTVIVKVKQIDTPERRAARARAAEEARRSTEARAKAERLKAQAEAAERRRATILAKKWPREIEQAVLDRQIRIGMTSEQVQVSRGKPASIHETIRASGTSEHWRYGDDQVLYFENGILTTIQRSR
jgi:hypothetical protein